MIQLYEHQRKSIDEIFEVFKTEQRCLYQLSTGGGKTVVFTTLAKEFNGKILVLCHRKELVQQTIDTFKNFGVESEPITSKIKKAKHNCDVYVSMVETAYNRLKKDPNFFNEIDLVICDECHIAVFEKCFPFFDNAKILGCTATPVSMNRINFTRCKYCGSEDIEFCCDEETMEWSKPFLLKSVYHNIVVGRSISELIEDGKLVQEINFIQPFFALSKLKEIQGELVSDEQENEESLFNVLLNYEKIAKGKKTIIFNPTSKVNNLIVEKFHNYNIRGFDSNSCENRLELVEWFKNTPDAILSNVNIFTTGFDVTDVECIILNRPTKSLSLFLQMVGRGARITNKIYKPTFILIDGGGNVNRHQEWSSESRNWRKIFEHGIEKEKPKKDDAEDIIQCSECALTYLKSLKECPECGAEKPKPTQKVKHEDNKVNEIITKLPLPNAKSIINFVNGDLNLAYRLLITQIVDLFKYYQVSKEVASRSEKRIREIIHTCYFSFGVLQGTQRTILYLVNKIKDKLNKYYA
jgi:superfamily II DNA or RNA helicase